MTTTEAIYFFGGMIGMALFYMLLASMKYMIFDFMAKFRRDIINECLPFFDALNSDNRKLREALETFAQEIKNGKNKKH